MSFRRIIAARRSFKLRPQSKAAHDGFADVVGQVRRISVALPRLYIVFPLLSHEDVQRGDVHEPDFLPSHRAVSPPPLIDCLAIQVDRVDADKPTEL